MVLTVCLGLQAPPSLSTLLVALQQIKNTEFAVNVHTIYVRILVFLPQLVQLKFPSTEISQPYCLVQNRKSIYKEGKLKKERRKGSDYSTEGTKGTLTELMDPCFVKTIQKS